MQRNRFESPQPLLIEVAGGSNVANSHVHTSGDVLLSHDTLGYGGIIAAMDVWLAAHDHTNVPFPQLKQGQSYLGGWGSPFCTIISAKINDSKLKPVGLDRRRWDNSKGTNSQYFEVKLSKNVSETDSVNWSTQLSISDTISVGMEASLPGIGKGSSSNSLTVGLQVGKSWSHSRTVEAGTEDTTSATLKAGEAELVLLSALEGPLSIDVVMQTRWEGTFEYKFINGNWQTMDLATLQERGLARPLDKGGIHNGLINMTIELGTVSEQDITTIGVTDTSEEGWDKAEAEILKQRYPERWYGYGLPTT